MRLGETPVPIPNTMVKTQAADGTILETIWESRWLPDPNFRSGGKDPDRSENKSPHGLKSCPKGKIAP